MSDSWRADVARVWLSHVCLAFITVMTAEGTLVTKAENCSAVRIFTG
jgi:hypothetical protein